MEIVVEQVVQFEHYVRFVSYAPEHNRQCFYLLGGSGRLMVNVSAPANGGGVGDPYHHALLLARWTSVFSSS